MSVANHVRRGLITSTVEGGRVIRETFTPMRPLAVPETFGGLMALAEAVGELIPSSRMPVGETGYLDQTPRGLFAGRKPVLYGTDKFGRQFIAVRVRGKSVDGPGTAILTVFQRYIQLAGPLVCGYSQNSLGLGSRVDAEFLSAFVYLLTEGRGVFPAGYDPSVSVELTEE